VSSGSLAINVHEDAEYGLISQTQIPLLRFVDLLHSSPCGAARGGRRGGPPMAAIRRGAKNGGGKGRIR